MTRLTAAIACGPPPPLARECTLRTTLIKLSPVSQDSRYRISLLLFHRFSKFASFPAPSATFLTCPQSSSVLPSPVPLTSFNPLPCRAVIRSKGFVWVANQHRSVQFWSHAGHFFEFRPIGLWSGQHRPETSVRFIVHQSSMRIASVTTLPAQSTRVLTRLVRVTMLALVQFQVAKTGGQAAFLCSGGLPRRSELGGHCRWAATALSMWPDAGDYTSKEVVPLYSFPVQLYIFYFPPILLVLLPSSLLHFKYTKLQFDAREPWRLQAFIGLYLPLARYVALAVGRLEVSAA